MKAGWRVVSLGEVCTVVNGGTPKSNVAAYWGGDVNWLTPKDMGQMTDRHIAETPRKITAKGLDNCSARPVPAGSVILSTRAPIGHLAINDTPMAFNQGCRGMMPGANLDPVFLFHLLSANTKALNDLGTGTTFKELSATALRMFPIPLPPLDEQKRIVAVLDEAFEGLDRARANAEANLADARELFDSTLRGVFHSVEQTAPKHTLAAVAQTFGRGKSRHRPRNDPKLYGGNFPFVQTGDIRNSDGFVTAFSQTYNELGLAQSKLWPEGTVCITIAANIAETAILGFPACFPDSIIGMVCDPEKVRAAYIELMLRYFAADLKEQGKGSAQDNINLATFEQSLFPIPSIAEQVRIVEQLSEIAQERRNLEAHFLDVINSLDTLRQSLLKKAFSGELT